MSASARFAVGVLLCLAGYAAFRDSTAARIGFLLGGSLMGGLLLPGWFPDVPVAAWLLAASAAMAAWLAIPRSRRRTSLRWRRTLLLDLLVLYALGWVLLGWLTPEGAWKWVWGMLGTAVFLLALRWDGAGDAGNAYVLTLNLALGLLMAFR